MVKTVIALAVLLAQALVVVLAVLFAAILQLPWAAFVQIGGTIFLCGVAAWTVVASVMEWGCGGW